MAKKIYEVIGTCEVTVLKRVKANSPEEAMELADDLFQGIHSFLGNGDSDKLIGVYDCSESINGDDYVKWEDAYETDDDRYDEKTDACTYRCVLCGEEFECENDDDFDDNVIDDLWEHIEMEHEEEYEACQDWSNLEILEKYFERED